MGNACSTGYACQSTIDDFPMDINGTAIGDAAGKVGSDPDIGGIGVLIAFSAALFLSTVLAGIVHGFEWFEIHHIKQNRGYERDDATKRVHHILDKILVAWSDQQLVLGLATSIAVLALWCSFSTYHLNLIKQWLIFCSVTHVNSLVVHCDYFNPKHSLANILRVVLIGVHTILAIVIISHRFQGTIEWTPTVGNLTPLQAVNSSCWLSNATRVDSLTEVKGWGGYGISGKWLFIASLIFIGIALAALAYDKYDIDMRKGTIGWWLRSFFLAGNATVGIIVFVTTLNLRKYMVSHKWVADDKENAFSYGQFVPIVLAGLVLFSALQSYSDEIPNTERRRLSSNNDGNEMGRYARA